MLTAKTLAELKMQLWDVKMTTDDSLEKSALDAAIAAIGQMEKRAKQQAAANSQASKAAQ